MKKYFGATVAEWFTMILVVVVVLCAFYGITPTFALGYEDGNNVVVVYELGNPKIIMVVKTK